jgi:hypothetical protein
VEPIGTLPVHTNDHYMQFWIGYQDGSILRDNSDPSGNFPHFGDCPSGNSAEFCAGWKFGWNMEEAEINPPSPSKCPEKRYLIYMNRNKAEKIAAIGLLGVLVTKSCAWWVVTMGPDGNSTKTAAITIAVSSLPDLNSSSS